MLRPGGFARLGRKEWKARASRDCGQLPLPAGERGGVRGLRHREVGSPSPPPSPRWGEGVPPCRHRTPCLPKSASTRTKYALPIRPRANIRPDLIDLLCAEHAGPRRHLALAVLDHLVEARALVRLELQEIGRRAGVAQP